MKYSFHPSAKTELNKANDYYEKSQPGLGLEFAKECYLTIHLIIKYPKAWSFLSKNTCQCLTNRFPDGIIYQILENELYNQLSNNQLVELCFYNASENIQIRII